MSLPGTRNCTASPISWTFRASPFFASLLGQHRTLSVLASSPLQNHVAWYGVRHNNNSTNSKIILKFRCFLILCYRRLLGQFGGTHQFLFRQTQKAIGKCLMSNRNFILCNLNLQWACVVARFLEHLVITGLGGCMVGVGSSCLTCCCCLHSLSVVDVLLWQTLPAFLSAVAQHLMSLKGHFTGLCALLPHQ